MVYNGISNGLNDTLWAPHYALSMVPSKLRSVEVGAYMADRDIGEICLNFILGEEVRSFCGVGFYNVSNEEDLERGRIGW